MFRCLILVSLLPLLVISIRCYFESDPLTSIAKTLEDPTKAKEYECPPADKYCIYFEGNVELKGENQTFSVRSCQSDIAYYLGPIGEKIGQKIEAQCQDAGVTRNKIGPISYYFNCCTDMDCKLNSAPSLSTSGVFVMTLLMTLFSKWIL
ncbi:unnamed protein product [Bursaphelenchus xylophilus]|uniref:(pine wood nematode) hypothetical protein n=1 Tax=Bursaphelenchus xylophilus TaxID=6326 RepID=A0A1I7SVX8_BURXY|nr:unnamed protein product [Bursaphelenchus xylophilus]CAG9098467.1 unnamed protein product [Bursaphelenchus xylophilus]